MLIGQTILCLLVFRVVWGFVGTRYAKFSSFVFGPRTIIAYARTILSRSGGGYAGHNPAWVPAPSWPYLPCCC